MGSFCAEPYLSRIIEPPPPNRAGVDPIRRLISQRQVRTFSVVEHKVCRQPNQQLAHGGIAIEVHIFMLDAAPQALDKDVVKRTIPSILVFGDPLALEHSRVGLTGKLRSLVAIEYFGPAARAAASRQFTQNAASMVLLIRQLSTWRVYQLESKLTWFDRPSLGGYSMLICRTTI